MRADNGASLGPSFRQDPRDRFNAGGESLMKGRIRAGFGAAVALGIGAAMLATGAMAQAKAAKDVHIIFVTHGQAVDPYWSVVKKGVEDGQKVMGSRVD